MNQKAETDQQLLKCDNCKGTGRIPENKLKSLYPLGRRCDVCHGRGAILFNAAHLAKLKKAQARLVQCLADLVRSGELSLPNILRVDAVLKAIQDEDFK